MSAEQSGQEEIPEGMVRNSEGYIVPMPVWWEGWPDAGIVLAARLQREKDWKDELRQRASGVPETKTVIRARRLANAVMKDAQVVRDQIEELKTSLPIALIINRHKTEIDEIFDDLIKAE